MDGDHKLPDINLKKKTLQNSRSDPMLRVLELSKDPEEVNSEQNLKFQINGMGTDIQSKSNLSAHKIYS